MVRLICNSISIKMDFQLVFSLHSSFDIISTVSTFALENIWKYHHYTFSWMSDPNVAPKNMALLKTTSRNYLIIFLRLIHPTPSPNPGVAFRPETFPTASWNHRLLEYTNYNPLWINLWSRTTILVLASQVYLQLVLLMWNDGRKYATYGRYGTKCNTA